MCGICGFVTKDKVNQAAVLIRMNTVLRHRGPDDEGYACVSEGCEIAAYSGRDTVPELKGQVPLLAPDRNIRAGMGFRRLSIIDVSALGHQPMFSEGKNIAITFNGEIYNYKDLKAELEEKGFRFAGESDTEVVLKGYECWGRDVVHRLNGMFALAILDMKKNTVWLARDRMGIKPLFYHHSGDALAWASEIKSVLQADWLSPEINPEGLMANYYLQTTPSPQTCFRNIWSVEPGTWMEVDMQSLSISSHTYWKIPVGVEHQSMTLEDAASELDHRLQEAVRLQLNADVPVISLMSGGVDSTTITAIASQQDPAFQCYTLGFDGTGEGADELPQAIAMARKLGINQKIHLIKAEDIVADLHQSLAHFEEPYSSLEVVMSASRYLHQEGYKVVLNGNGADELFGGYPYVMQLQQWKKRRKAAILRPAIPPVGNYLKKVKNYLQLDSVFKYFANSRSAMRPYQIAALLNPEGKTAGEGMGVPNERGEGFRDDYEALFYYDLKYSVASHHVYRDDLSAMRFSLEMRYPFLDHTLIEWVAGLPLSLRYNRAMNKPLLRATAARYIEGVNLQMPKKGFNLPLDTWWTEHKAIKDYMEQQLHLLKKRGIMNNKTIDEWQQHCNTSLDLSKIWQLITTEVWLQTYID
jgi:asparagine synthase (glutamine-hydrolysing)